ncbi:MAG: hypothetical protein RL077_1071 [Verrucomicrobiota bacterium]|jgi:hypothetical protein
MKNSFRFHIVGVLVLAWLGSAAVAQTPPSLENDVRNIFSQQPNTAWPPPPPSLTIDSRLVTPNQFKGGTVLGGWQTTRIASQGAMITNAGFELPQQSESGFSYSPSGSSWNFQGGAGIARNGSPWYIPNALGGAQGAFLQIGGSSVEQTFPVPAGTYVVSFKAVGRKETSVNGVQVWFNNYQVQAWSDTQFSQDVWQTYTTPPITVAASGSYSLKFVGVGGTTDRATVIDDVVMRQTGGAPNYLAGSSSAVTGATSLILPKGFPFLNGVAIAGQGTQLESVTMSRPLAARQTSYALGASIDRPVFSVDGRALTEAEKSTFYLEQPANFTSERFYYSPHALKVYATQPGVVDVTWVERLSKAQVTKQYVISATPVKPVKQIFWTENGFKGPVIQVPSSRVATVNVVYNTLFPSTVATAYVRPGEIVNPVANTTPADEKRTCWYSPTDGSIHAYNIEGRIFMEFLGALRSDGVAREQLAIEVVEVVKEPTTRLERVAVGDELSAPNGEASLSYRVVAGLNAVGQQDAFIYQHVPANSTASRLFAIAKTTPLFSGGVEIPSNEVLVFWMQAGELSLLWPKYYVGYILDWPTSLSSYSLYARSLDLPTIAPTAVQLNSADSPVLIYQDDPTGKHAQLSTGYQFSTQVTVAQPFGRSLVRYTNGNDIWFERVYSQLDTTFTDFGSAPISVSVGSRITPPSGISSEVGYIRAASGDAYNYLAYLDPFVVGFDEARRGAIIGVNALSGNDQLEVWWFTPSAPKSAAIKPTYWPSSVRKYKLVWPTTPAEIVLASNAGSNDLPSLQANGSIYVQNTSGKPGYNPNEEHALMLNGRAWALRDDLNETSSSPAYVLIHYIEADERPAMTVFKVLREKLSAGVQFLYTAEAGKVLQAPMPLPILPLPLKPALVDNTWTWLSYFNASTWFPSAKKDQLVANHEIPRTPSADKPTSAGLTDSQLNDEAPRYGQFTFVDRKGTTWVYRGMHDGASKTATFSMRYFYRTMPGFWFPSLGTASQPAEGTIVPYLRKDGSESPVLGEPLEIKFTPVWPSAAPELRVGETLARTKYGLPAVRGQTSAEILYQQSKALDSAGALSSATLFDPTRAKTYPLSTAGLAKIPSSAATDLYMGKTYFTRLPPHLVLRFYFDPNVGTLGTLFFKGEFKQAALGEDYLLLNLLSVEEVKALKELVDSGDTARGAWNNAIDGLATTLQTFKEDTTKKGTYIVDKGKDLSIGATALAAVTNDDTAVDSYAISAVGGGKGYVVMAVGNGRAFTPIDEPVSLYVFKVVPPLYRGELKVVMSSNPLDEKLTLRHSADFAGQPEGYDFEWMYAPPVNGAAPALFTFSRAVLLGNSPDWQVYNQPPADFKGLRLPETSPTARPRPAPYIAAVDATTPIQVAVRDALDQAAHGLTLPQAVVRKEFAISTLPLRAFLSLELGSRDSAEVYLNQARVAVINRPSGDNTPTMTPSSEFSPLRLVYEIPAAILKTNQNVISLELYTDADKGAASTINVRLEGQMISENRSGWVALGAGPGETPGQIPGTIKGKSQHVIQGNSLLTLTDNYFTMRYRARESGNAAYVANGGWSTWVDPQLAEGWIKRALAGINPFQQRVTDLFSNSVNLDVSLVQQAGRRWEGDIALNLSNINKVGLIEIYETILRRGKALSIEGTPAINYGAANDALLLAAGYLSDLYMILGNEAYADAANPTIAFASDSGRTYGDVSTSLFAFKGQFASVLQEELALLRGRDNALAPGTQVSPVYNRMVWNYTRGIDSGEAIYALNYNIKDLNGDGVVGADDAAMLYPQGHGDAYGHYLTALTGYYTLLANPNFSWQPRIEAVTVLGKAVAVDYFDERKFAAAAVALARTASQIVDLTYRQSFSTGATGTWSNLADGKVSSGVTRRWGVDDWAVRGWQGAYFNWMVGNSMLPAVDPDPSHEGIQKIDRTTVPELSQLILQASAIQQSMSNAEGRVNPLGLATGAMAFDISPSAVDNGTTHFEQIYGRATMALQNTITAFANAKSSTQFLREQEDSLAAARAAINQQEQAYTNQLIELYGTAYGDDIGPGKTFTQDYSGPDLLHYMYVDIPEGLVTQNATIYKLLLNPTFNEANPDSINWNSGQTISYSIASNGDFLKPANWVGRRASPGKVQTAVSDLLLARLALAQAAGEYSGLKDSVENSVTIFKANVNRHAAELGIAVGFNTSIAIIEVIQQAIGNAQDVAEATLEALDKSSAALSEGLPSVVGLATDATAPARSFIKLAAVLEVVGIRSGIAVAKASSRILDQSKSILERIREISEKEVAWAAEYQQLIYDLRDTLGGLVDKQSAVDTALRHYDQAQRNLRSLVASGDRLQAERQTFRLSASALVQGYRTKDLAFRAFRDEALEKYKQLYELSARYAYLAATAFDYETGLLNSAGNTVGAAFLDKIVQARSPGVMVDGTPQFGGASTGDPGLAGALAGLNSSWSVAKSRLGFNNPDLYRSTFSLRTEKYRIVNGTAGDQAWREVLMAAKRDNLMDDPDAARYCLNLGLDTSAAVPGFVFEFASTITPGVNFFGKPLAGGDITYSATSFATKIRQAGVAFSGYVGLVDPTGTSATTTAIGAVSPTDPYTAYADGLALSGTPYVYLIPAGVDSLRSPMEKSSVVRTWTVVDQAVPFPFNINQGNYASAKSWTSSNSLTENYVLRQHQAFRAVADGAVFSTDRGFTNGRLIGRSVWNSRWKLVIPAETLLADPKKGMQVFIDTVKNIKIHFETYSTAGN